MHERWGRTQTATVIGSFVLSLILTSGAAIGQQERREAQVQQPSQQEMIQQHYRDIEDRVEMRLARSSALAGSDIKVSVEDRIVSLSGTVGSERDKDRALRIVRRIRGVKDVKDELSVDKDAVDKRRNVKVEDEVLAKQVAMKLATETFPGAQAEEDWFFGWEVEGYNWELDVDVDDGVVTLEGEVDSYVDIASAIKAARSVPGVRSVESDLDVDYFDYPYHRGLYYYGYPYYRGYP